MTAGIDRYWFFTWTTYGQWLPGDPRGSVTRVREPLRRHRFEHDTRDEPCEPAIPGLFRSAQNLLVGSPVWLELTHATVLLAQFHETVAVRRWLLIAVAIMANHIHTVVGVPGDPKPADILGDLKSYGSRRLNKLFVRPRSGCGDSWAWRKSRKYSGCAACECSEGLYPAARWGGKLIRHDADVTSLGF